VYDENWPSSWISLSGRPATLAEDPDHLRNQCPEYVPLMPRCPTSSRRCWTRYSFINASLPGPSPVGRGKRGVSEVQLGQSS